MSIRISHAPLLASIALSLAMTTGTAWAERARDWNRTFPVAAHPAIHVRADDARVRIHAGADGAVKAAVHWRSRRWGFTSPSREPAVRLEQTAGAVEIEVREGAIFALFGGVSEQITIDVTVPAECDLRVHTGDGSIGVEAPLRGSFDLGTGDGRVTLRGLHGDLRLVTGDGAVDALDLDGTVIAHSGDGHLHFDGRFDRVDVSAADGRVEVTARPGSRPRSDWRLETEDGPLELLIPRDFAAELDARTGDGRIHFDLPVTVSGRLDPHVIRGRLNGGGPVLRMRTGDGSLTLGVTP
jgi:Putative adhesin